MSFTLCYSQHHTRKPWIGRVVKLLIVGNSGVVQPCCNAVIVLWYSRDVIVRFESGVQGKTTLCQCLLSVPGSDLKLHDGTATSHQQFLEDPESLCSTVSWDDNTDKVKWVYKVQDTPGNHHTWTNDMQMHICKYRSRSTCLFEAATDTSCELDTHVKYSAQCDASVLHFLRLPACAHND